MNKTAELEALLYDLDPHVTLLTETWLHAGVLDNEIVPPTYKILRCDRQTRGGGVAIVIKESISVTILPAIPEHESIFCKMDFYGNSIVVGVVYRPPSADLAFLEQLYDYVQRFRGENVKFILAGDFNLPDIDWSTMSPAGTNVKHAETLINLAFSCGLTQIVSAPTRITATAKHILDLLFISSTIRCDSVVVMDGLSDHELVFATFSFQKRCNKSKAVIVVKDFNRANDESILDYLEMSLDAFSVEDNVDVLWCKFKQICQHAIDMFVPDKIKNKKLNPWVTRQIIHMKRKLRRMRRSGRPRDSTITTLSAALKSEVKKAKDTFFNTTLVNFLKEAPGKFWRYLGDSKTSSISLMIDGTPVSQAKAVAEEFNRYFHSVYSPKDTNVVTEPEGFTSSMQDLVVHQEGIFNLLLNLDSKKAGGPDNIPTAFLRRYAEWISHYFFIIYNASLAQCSLPSDWKGARILPIHKSADRLTVSHYRPISLTSISCKMLEHIICRHLTIFLEENSLLSDAQHGFRRGLSTVTQLLSVCHDFSLAINNKDQIDAVFLDYAKAFDKVPHNNLLCKLYSMGINSKLIDFIRAYLQNRYQYVQIDKYCSGTLQVTSGVPQGSVLGPILFLIYINDIVNVIPSDVKIKLFADDCVLYSTVKCTADQISLQKALTEVSGWCKKWDMFLNADKFLVLNICRNKTILQHSYSVDAVY